MKNILTLLILILCFQVYAQQPAVQAPLNNAKEPTAKKPAESNLSTDLSSTSSEEEDKEKPNGKRIRRQLNLIAGVDHDEEFLIPDKEILIKGIGASENFEIKRIKGTDYFRFTPKKASTGVATINDKKTGQILVEIRYDIREFSNLENKLREIQSLLGDIEGLEYKIVNNKILLDGYVLLPRDLIRIGNVIKQFGDSVKSLATLSPLSRKKIVEYIARDVNNPEVSITAVGDYIKMEGVVNSDTEKNRIKKIVELYMPDLVIEKSLDADSPVQVIGRKNPGKIDDFIIDLVTIRKDEDKVEPPPKMVQVVVHFVQFVESYGKNFKFVFAPSLAAVGNVNRAPTSTINDTANLISNLLPKLQWAKAHGYAKVLDTASILTQDKKPGTYSNEITIFGTLTTQTPTGPSQQPNNTTANVSVAVTPTIKSERSGLIELPLNVKVDDTDGGKKTTNTVNTIISVRDRQSAAFAGIIKKKSGNEYGGDPGVADAIVTFQSKKKYEKSSSNFVVFVTPIIKSSASAGVDQVKKKFRLRD